mmetsp:Transcript_31004/g.88592  ORF Transcript_31004/g.88592 Transcript_31004/m.88592 type:complete len:384 (+) Transcript_31004:264-1415(+)
MLGGTRLLRSSKGLLLLQLHGEKSICVPTQVGHGHPRPQCGERLLLERLGGGQGGGVAVGRGVLAEVGVVIRRVPVDLVELLPAYVRRAERDVCAEQVDVAVVLQHRAEVRVPEEDRQLALPHRLVEGQQALVGQLGGGAVHEVLDAEPRLDIAGSPAGLLGGLLGRFPSLRDRNLPRLLGGPGLLKRYELFDDLVVRQVAECRIGGLVLLAHNPAVEQGDVQQVEHGQLLGVLEVRGTAELAVHVEPRVELRQDVEARAQALLDVGIPGTRGLVQVAAAAVQLEQKVADHLEQLVEADVPLVFGNLELVAQQEDVAQREERAGAVGALQEHPPGGAKELDVLDAIGLRAVLHPRSALGTRGMRRGARGRREALCNPQGNGCA